MTWPRIISLVPRLFEDGDWGGVARSDHELRTAIPTLTSLNTKFRSRLRLRRLLKRNPDAIVIAASEVSLLVPRTTRTIVVYHGVAQTHFDRDPHWRGPRSRRLCRAQRAMFTRPNRWYVSYAAWTSREFSRQYAVPAARIIPNWVRPFDRKPVAHARPVVLGDWRTFNKGREVIPALAERYPQWEFRPLRCTYETRVQAYQAADAYLCLSLSEGGSFSLCDAEAAALPIVTTDVGNCEEFTDAEVIPWEHRDDLPLVGHAIERALTRPRGPSLYQSWTFDRWQSAWRDLVSEVAASGGRPPVLWPG